jgi:signal transduction histidine kinase
MRWRPRLATVLVLITLVIGLLPLGGIAVLRLYESALIRQTESELIAQGALIAASYRAQLERLSASRPDKVDGRRPAGRGLGLPADYGNPVTSPPRPQDPDTLLRPRFAVLDLASDPILPPPDDARAPPAPAHPAAVAAGRELTTILRETQRITLAGIRVTDPAGVIVATTGEELGGSVLHHEEVRRALTGEYVSAMRWRGSNPPSTPPIDSISRGTRIRVFVAVPIVHAGRVVGSVLLARTPWNIWQALYGKRRELTVAGLGLLATIVGLALLASLTIARPVRLLRDQARRAARGERNAVVPLAHPGTREIAELSETVAEMAQTLETRASYIRDFAAQVSHEFKTPLTAMQGAVEMLREHGAGMSDAERARFLDIVERDTRRLSQLVRRLLELARADVMTAGAESAAIGETLQAVATRWREAGLAVEVVAPAPELRAAIAAETLESILSTLLDNARVHGGAAARVRLGATARDGTVEVDVADDGAGVSAANRARIFEPFFTTARDRGGTGMGLSIARSLARAHGGELALLPSDRGAHLRLTLVKGSGSINAGPAGNK